MQGGKRYQEVWGWGELARRVQSEARFREIFHEARYNLALCRLRQAQIAPDRPQRAHLAEAAENDILFTRRFFPDMGGAVWYDRYDELLKRIQRLANRPAVGLSALIRTSTKKPCDKEYLPMKRTMLVAVAFWTISAGECLADRPNLCAGKDGWDQGVFWQDHQHVVDWDQFRAARGGADGIPGQRDRTRRLREFAQRSAHGPEVDAQRRVREGHRGLEEGDDGGRAAGGGPGDRFLPRVLRAQLALSGTGDPRDAGRQMLAFINKSPNNFHYWKACERLGDLFVSIDRFADAQTFYAKLGQAPWPDYKIRAQVAVGRSCLAQGDAAAADKAFDEALNTDASGELAEVQRMAARVGKARCMVLTGRTDAALRSLNEILERTDEKHAEVNAMAYNALGTALRKAGKPKEAILAFLHVHLYPHAARPGCRGGRQSRETVHRDPQAEKGRRHAGNPRREVPEQPLGQRREVICPYWRGPAMDALFVVIFLFLSVALVALMVINVLAARRDSVTPPALIQALELRLGEDRFQEACDLVRADRSVLARVLAAGLPQLIAGDEKAAEAMEEFGALESIKMHARLGHVWLIAQLAPLFGLLGSVHGLMAAFETIVSKGATPRPIDLAGGIGTALVATAVGLWIAVVAVAFHQIVLGRINRLLAEAGILAERFAERFAAARKPD